LERYVKEPVCFPAAGVAPSIARDQVAHAASRVGNAPGVSAVIWCNTHLDAWQCAGGGQGFQWLCKHGRAVDRIDHHQFSFVRPGWALSLEESRFGIKFQVFWQERFTFSNLTIFASTSSSSMAPATSMLSIQAASLTLIFPQ
jgi:hypothetical protein